MGRFSGSRGDTLLLATAAVALQAVVWAILIPVFTAHVGYGLHDLTDVAHYLYYAEQMARGSVPYVDVPFEYPPLALPVFLLAPRDGTLATYEYWFSVEMIMVCAASSVVVTMTARRVWSGLGRPLAAAAVFAVGIAAAGALSLNRFDPVVGLFIALSVLALVSRRFTLAGIAVGLGFAVKLAPVVLLPLVLLLAGKRRVVILAAALIAAVLPFLPFLMLDRGAFTALSGYQTGRGLQIESLAATGYLVRAAVAPGAVRVVVRGGGSLELAAWNTALLARLAPLVMLTLLAVAYLAVWRARRVLRGDPEWVAPAALGIILAFLCGNKVLSPQHLLWTLPLVALCAVARPLAQRILGILMLVAVVLTQVEFPAYYFRLQRLDPVPITIIVIRNVLLAAAFVVTILGLLHAARAELGEEAREQVSAQAGHPERLVGDDGGEDDGQHRRRDGRDAVGAEAP